MQGQVPDTATEDVVSSTFHFVRLIEISLQIRAAFMHYGTVKECNILKNQEGRSKGFALKFVLAVISLRFQVVRSLCSKQKSRLSVPSKRPTAR